MKSYAKVYWRRNWRGVTKWRYTIYAANHEELAVSSQAYADKRDALRSLMLVNPDIPYTVGVHREGR